MEVHQVSLSVCLSLPHSLSLKDIQEPLIFFFFNCLFNVAYIGITGFHASPQCNSYIVLQMY